MTESSAGKGGAGQDSLTGAARLIGAALGSVAGKIEKIVSSPVKRRTASKTRSSVAAKRKRVPLRNKKKAGARKLRTLKKRPKKVTAASRKRKIR
jgi:hypothetical protein